MNKRQFLISGLSVLSIIGLAFAAYPFIVSMLPSEKADAEIPRININEMSAGSYKIVLHPRLGEDHNGYGYSLLIIKRKNGDINAWNLLTKGKEVGMPDYYWWRVYFTCAKFGPTLVDGVIDESKPIKCHESSESTKYISENSVWSIDGVALKPGIANLEQAKGIVEGDYFVLRRPR